MHSSDFTDDSSKSLGLDHSSTAASSEPLRRLGKGGGGIDKYLRESEETHKLVTDQLREKRRRELMAQGMTLRQATEQEAKEYENPLVKRELYDREGSKTREIENLMGLRDHDVKGGSSSRNRFKERKKGTPVCQEHGIEDCGCGPSIGRPFEDGRSEQVCCKVKDSAKEQLIAERVSAGAVVQSIVDRAQELGMGLREYLDHIGAKDIGEVTRRLGIDGTSAAA